MPNEALPRRGFSAEYFPQFDGVGQRDEPATRHLAATQKSRCGRMHWRHHSRCRCLAIGSSQRFRKALKFVSMTRKSLGLTGDQPKNRFSAPVSPPPVRHSAASA
jgi:hypothetical protein